MFKAYSFHALFFLSRLSKALNRKGMLIAKMKEQNSFYLIGLLVK